MKKNKFLSLLGLMLMAAALTTFTACSGSDDDDNQSGTTSMYDDLDYFQKALCTIDDAGNLVSYNTGTILFKDEPHTSTSVWTTSRRLPGSLPSGCRLT